MEESLAKIKEELKCSICLELFNEPRTLPCNHAFCGACIKGYLDKRVRENRELNCPICKESIPNRGGNAEDVFKSLKLDFKLKSMVHICRGDETRGNPTVKSYRHDILSTINRIVKSSKENEQHIENVCHVTQTVRNQIKAFSEEAKEVIQTYEDKLLEQVSKYKDEELQKLNENGVFYAQVEEKAQQLLKDIDDGANCSMSQIPSAIRDINISVTQNTQSHSVVKLEFNPNQKVREFIASCDGLGTVTRKKSESHSCPMALSSEGSSHQSHLALKRCEPLLLSFHDSMTCCVSGIAVFENGKVLLVDSKSDYVFLYSNIHILQHKKKLRGIFDVAVWESSRAILSCPSISSLIIVSVVRDAIEKVDSKDLEGMKGKHLAQNCGFLAVCSDCIIHVYNLNNNYECIMDTSLEHTSRIADVTLNPVTKKLYLSDQCQTDPKIICISFDGTPLWSKSLSGNPFPSGIAVTKADICVSCWDTSEIVMISFEGEETKRYKLGQDEAKNPFKMFFDSKRKQLLISQNGKSVSKQARATIEIMEFEDIEYF